MVILKEIIGSGTERIVYRHPAFADRVIKIKRAGSHVDRNVVEHAFHRVRKPPIDAGVPQLFGWIETNLGKGLEYQLICDPCGTPSRTVQEAVRSGILTPCRARALLAEFFDAADRRGLIIYDDSLSNFLFRPGDDGLVLVDGFGPRHWNCRLWFRSRFAFLARKKIRQTRRATLQVWERWCREAAVASCSN